MFGSLNFFYNKIIINKNIFVKDKNKKKKKFFF